ncbi:hypothetical protein ACFFU1_16505 [Algibacter miyuki]|uniref:Uncharacterized protein n=1 Tax=Algibacter miyuki TaxID=1306933 RepID=A0ABV5H4W0_9FLAO|nr:hypothetical protein [Algibacter miyuki]MDN3665580.1 hypothetical protein [Algibacter miyuki]
MKKITKKKTLILLSIGMFVIATSQIFSQFMELSDFAKGSFMGIGLGLLLTALIIGNFRTIQ